MFLTVLALAVAAPAVDAAPAAPCTLAQPAGCATTSDLLAAPGAADAIRALAGDQRANLLAAGLPLVADQALAVLGGPPDKPRAVAGAWLFTACRQDSCGEKGAVVVDATGKVVALGIVHGSCGVEPAKPGCARRQSLSLYGGDPMLPFRRAILEWAERAGDVDDLAVFEDGINEPVVALDGEFDGDRLPDHAALVANAGGQGYRLEVRRGADPAHRVVVQQVADPAGFTLAQGEDGTLRFGVDASASARWQGDRFAVTAGGSRG